MHDFYARRVEAHLQQLLEGHTGAIERSRIICHELRRSLRYDSPISVEPPPPPNARQSPNSSTPDRPPARQTREKPPVAPADKPPARQARDKPPVAPGRSPAHQTREKSPIGTPRSFVQYR